MNKEIFIADSCFTCSFCDLRHHECHRYPPVIIEPQSDLLGYFPTINMDYWCGEYKERVSEVVNDELDINNTAA